MNPDALFARSGLSIDRLRSFLAVADAGGIARAAPKNAVRQSQLSRQITELEAFFGAALVDRRGRGLALTPAGARLAIVVRETLDGLRDVAAATTREDVVAIPLGAGDSVLHGWVIPHAWRALADAERGRRTTLSLVALSGPEVALRVSDARLDLGIVRAPDLAPGLRSRAIGSIAYALYVPRALGAHAATAKASVVDLLATLPLATQHGDPELDRRLQAAARRAGVAITPSLVCETFPQAQRAVMTGRFAAILPTLARADLPRSGFDEISGPIFGSPARVHLVWHPRLERQRPRAFALVGPLSVAFARGARV